MRIVLTTIGSLGDLHPFIAIGQALAAHGARPVLGVPQTHVAKCRAAGLETHAIMPDFDQIAAEQGLTRDEAVRGVMRSSDFLIRTYVLPYLDHTLKALDRLAEDARGIVGAPLLLAAPTIAQKHRIPYIPAILQPMSFVSACDPPRIPEFALMARPPLGALALRWNRFLLGLVRREMLRRYAKPLDALRAGYGLPPLTSAPAFEFPVPPPLTLALYSQALAALPPDAPIPTCLTGFPWFDSESGAPEGLAPDLAAFLDAGDPPLVFTLGSFAVYGPGNFYTESMAAARALGRRAVLLVGPDATPPARTGGDIFVAAYAPHSELFPRVAAIIHHGGVGTTGQALRAGKPQLVVPHMADQPDHAARMVERGVARTIHARHYNVARATKALAALLHDDQVGARSRAAARAIAKENGARTAADAILTALGAA